MHGIEVRARHERGRWVFYHALVHDVKNRAIYDLMDPPKPSPVPVAASDATPAAQAAQ